MSALREAHDSIIGRATEVDPRNDDINLVLHSQALATLAVAEEQRTTNLIAYMAIEEALATGTTPGLNETIRVYLGLHA